MNVKPILIVVSVIFAVSCNTDRTHQFITGTYINHAGGTYSVADDTLVIEHSENSNYLIHRKTGFNLIRDGRKGKREYETEIWNAIYDEETKCLTETRRGRLITFYPKAKKLVVGKREYIKLN